MQRASKGCDFSKKKKGMGSVLSMFIDTKNTTTTVSVYISYSARALNA